MNASGFDLFRTLGKTVQTWQAEILRMFVFPYSNGITEGFHRKMKLIQRRAAIRMSVSMTARSIF